jgi:hypothetical protein
MNPNHITGYQLAVQTNKVLKSKGLKEIPTQMVYNYIRNHLIPTIETEDGVRIHVTAGQAWMTKFVQKREVKVKG